MDSPSLGSLRITTLRKLPTMAPKIKKKIYSTESACMLDD